MAITITDLIVYPVKSLAGIRVHSSLVTGTGLAMDRHWMLVDEQGKFISQRSVPALTRFKTFFSNENIGISHEGSEDIFLPYHLAAGEQATVTIWDDECTALKAGPDINEWFSKILGRECYLVRQMESAPRRLAEAEGIVSFADSSPVLVVNKSSLEDFNSRLDTGVTETHFRPNVVVDGHVPYAEDTWDVIEAGSARMQAVKTCGRCQVIGINPGTGKPDPSVLKTLASYRNVAGSIKFGLLVRPLVQGVLSVGDTINILSERNI